MELNNISREELETISYTDITSMILKDNKKPMNTAIIFKKICELLGYSDDDFSNKIGDFYTSLTTDKRFVMLDSAEWDLRDNHAVKIELDLDDEEESDSSDEEEETNDDAITDDQGEENLEEPIDDEELDIDDDIEDDIEDLAIIDEDEEEMGM